MCALLVLWDIDHTLIENHGVNKETYALAFELLTGRAAAHPARTEGRTEPEIMRGMLARHGIEATPDHIARIPEVLESATLANAAKLRERGCELPGARDALTALTAVPGIIQSVLTGNIRPNAATKLAAFGLGGFIDFEVGGYGSDDEDRTRLVTVAQKRAAARHGVTFNAVPGGRVVAVATGSHSMNILRAEGADAVLPDLRDTSAVLKAVTQQLGA